MVKPDAYNLENPGIKLPLIGFSKKTIKIFLIGPFKFA